MECASLTEARCVGDALDASVTSVVDDDPEVLVNDLKGGRTVRWRSGTGRWRPTPFTTGPLAERSATCDP
jgi:hypothetical protein